MMPNPVPPIDLVEAAVRADRRHGGAARAAVDAGFTGEPWDLFAPAVSLEFGCRILADNFAWARRTYTGLTAVAETKIRASALAAYNGGRGGNAPDNILDRNHGYADQVIARYLRIRQRPA